MILGLINYQQSIHLTLAHDVGLYQRLFRNTINIKSDNEYWQRMN